MKKNRELVPPEIEGPDEHRSVGKGLGDGPVGAVLFLLAGDRVAADHEEFRTKETHACGTVPAGLLGFAGKVQVRAQDHATPVQGDRFLAGAGEDLPFPAADRGAPPPEVFGLPPVRLDDDSVVAPGAPGIGQAHKAAENPELEVRQVIEPVEDHGVRGPRPQLLELQHPPIERPSRGEPVLSDVPRRSVNDLRIIQHQDLRIEDACLDVAETGLGRGLDPLEFTACVVERTVEPLQLACARAVVHDRVRRIRNAPDDPSHAPLGDPFGSRKALPNNRARGFTHRSRPAPAAPTPRRPPPRHSLRR